MSPRRLTAINVGIPFIPNLPSGIDAYAQPTLVANVDGALFLLKGQTRPFRSTFEASLNVNLQDIDLARYFSYVPVPLNF